MFDFHAITRRKKKLLRTTRKKNAATDEITLKNRRQKHNSPWKGISNLINDVRQRFITIFLPKINLNAS